MGAFSFGLVPEETKRAVSEVHYRGDNDQSHYPTSKLIEQGESRPNEQLDKVVARPRYNISDAETGSRHKGTCRICYQIAHSSNITFLVIADRAVYTVLPDGYARNA